jgi:hypothetical protein
MTDVIAAPRPDVEEDEPTVAPTFEATKATAVAAAGPSTASVWARRLRPLARPCGYYLLSRIGVYFAALVAKWLFPKLHAINALGSMWDGAWYLKIASHGYPAHLIQEGDGSRWAFFPAWPAAIRGTSALTGLSLANSSVFLAFFFGLTSVIAIWLAVREHFGPHIADRTILFYVFFPMAFVLSMGYTEGLFLTAAGGCLYALSRRQWMTAALCAVVGSLTRDVGVFLILCVVVAAVPVVRKERAVRPLVAIALSPLGILGFMAFAWARVGSPVAFLQAEKFWYGAHFIWFRAAPTAMADVLRNGLHGLLLPSAVLATVALVFAYVGVTLLARMQKGGGVIPSYWWVFTVGALATAFSPYYPNSILRYSMAAFPLFVAMAWKVKANWDGAIIGVMACAQGALTMIVLIGPHHSIPVFP